MAYWTQKRKSLTRHNYCLNEWNNLWCLVWVVLFGNHNIFHLFKRLLQVRKFLSLCFGFLERMTYLSLLNLQHMLRGCLHCLFCSLGVLRPSIDRRSLKIRLIWRHSINFNVTDMAWRHSIDLVLLDWYNSGDLNSELLRYSNGLFFSSSGCIYAVTKHLQATFR